MAALARIATTTYARGITYRDDTEAALARADALEAELKRAEQERDRLRAEVEELRHPKPPPVEPPRALTVPRSEKLTHREVDALVVEVRRGLERSSNDAKARVIVSMVVLAFGGVIGTTIGPATGIMLATVGALALILSIAQYARDRSDAVLETVVMRPGDIQRISVGSSGVRFYVGERSAFCQSDEPFVLADQLSRYLPHAVVTKPELLT
ncbi:MAG TPA: hypothetical protein VGC41_26900 [Kofleriaceae bacterium]